MTTTMKTAIESYTELTNRTFKEVVTECNNGNKIIINSVMKIMFYLA